MEGRFRDRIKRFVTGSEPPKKQEEIFDPRTSAPKSAEEVRRNFDLLLGMAEKSPELQRALAEWQDLVSQLGKPPQERKEEQFTLINAALTKMRKRTITDINDLPQGPDAFDEDNI